jgi:Fe-S-cluster containining protein
MDFKPFFKQYEQLVAQVDAAFEKVKGDYGQCVHCRIGCADCCHALFDLTLVEALYIKDRFDKMDLGVERAELIERASEADRKICRLKRQAFKEHEAGKSEEAVLEEMALQRVRCPCLGIEDRCAIYDARPITCRVYGIPTVIGGKAHTCGMSGFQEGSPTRRSSSTQFISGCMTYRMLWRSRWRADTRNWRKCWCRSPWPCLPITMRSI